MPKSSASFCRRNRWWACASMLETRTERKLARSAGSPPLEHFEDEPALEGKGLPPQGLDLDH
eukprot:6459620-Alexandrium_andersonii.AAC.1